MYKHLAEKIKNGTCPKSTPVLVRYEDGTLVEDEAIDAGKDVYVIKSKALELIKEND